MKDSREKEVLKVEEALIRFHRRPVEAETGKLWQQRVMSRILEESDSRRVEPETGGNFGGKIWRLALVTSFLAVLLVTYAVDSSSNAQYELAELTLTDSVALDMVTSFEVL